MCTADEETLERSAEVSCEAGTANAASAASVVGLPQ